MRSVFRLLSLAMVLLIAALLSAVVTIAFSVHGREVTVPKLVGLTPSEATRLTTASGLGLLVERHFYSSDVPQGKIISQLPQAGTLVRHGWEVRVADSLGPQRVVIPNVVGQSGRIAQVNITQRGLQLEEEAIARISDAPSDQVLAQSPAANASGVSVPKMSILVAAPAEPPAFVMPDFIGQPLQAVKPEVEAAGMHVGTVTLQTTPPTSSTGQVIPGTIVGQTPSPGQKITAGAVIDFEISR